MDTRETSLSDKPTSSAKRRTRTQAAAVRSSMKASSGLPLHPEARPFYPQYVLDEWARVYLLSMGSLGTLYSFSPSTTDADITLTSRIAELERYINALKLEHSTVLERLENKFDKVTSLVGELSQRDQQPEPMYPTTDGPFRNNTENIVNLAAELDVADRAEFFDGDMASPAYDLHERLDFSDVAVPFESLEQSQDVLSYHPVDPAATLFQVSHWQDYEQAVTKISVSDYRTDNVAPLDVSDDGVAPLIVVSDTATYSSDTWHEIQEQITDDQIVSSHPLCPLGHKCWPTFAYREMDPEDLICDECEAECGGSVMTWPSMCVACDYVLCGKCHQRNKVRNLARLTGFSAKEVALAFLMPESSW